METSLAGRVAAVTGAARGIGLETARALHARGATVVLGDLDERASRAAAETLGDGSAEGMAVDVRSRASIVALLDGVVDRHGRIDVLVNNAAITVSRSPWEIDDQEWDRVLATNVRSVFVASQLVGPRMREQGAGRIVNMTSLAGQQGGTVAGAHYAAAKAGVIVLTKIFARELAASGVTVNAVAPAAIRTPVMDELPPEQIEASVAAIPVGRLGSPQEVGEVVAFLCSDAAAFITGATIDVNGGLSMR